MGKLTPKRQAWMNEYLSCWNATEAARRAGFSSPNTQGPRLLLDVGIQAALKARIDELTMGADEILVHLTEQARADMGVFFKVVEEWTYYPLPSYEIIDAREVEDDSDPDNPVKRVSYWVRHVVLDLDKVIDPQYSHLLSEFADSPKDGLSVKIYNKQAALQTLAKIRGLMVNRTELTGKAGGPIETKSDGLTDDKRIARIATILERARARRDRQTPGGAA